MITQEVIDKIEDIVRKETMNAPSVIHNFYHIKRVAVGAEWFASILNASEEQKRKSYIAGLLHDVVRPAQRGDHATPSAERAKQILTQLNFDEKIIDEIYWAVKNHSDLNNVANRRWKSVTEETVFLGDKILEIWGAYVVLRRSMFVGEALEYKNVPKEKALLKHHTKWLSLLTPEAFPRFSALAKYQYKWMYDFVLSLRSKKKWAVSLAGKFYDLGHEKQDMDRSIRSFSPATPEQKRIKREAVDYLNGKLFEKFGKMTK